MFAVVFIFYNFAAEFYELFRQMKYRIAHLLFLFMALSCCSTAICYGQQPTREQLLKLFYKAHTAQKANDSQAAIGAYQEILKLSPGLPDPYLQLGNLYATMEDAESLQKACVCYNHYLELKPESANAATLKEKIAGLMEKAAAGQNADDVAEEISEKPRFEIEIAPKDTVQVAEVPEPEPVVVPEPEPVVVSEPEPLVAEPLIAEMMESAPADSSLVGRWASAEMGDNGREMWIMDVTEKTDGRLWMRFNPHSYAKNEPAIASVHGWEAPAFKDGNTLVFTFKIERKKEEEATKRFEASVLGEFGSVMSQMFETGMEALTSTTNRGATLTSERQSRLDSLRLALLASDSLDIDSSDSLLIMQYPVKVYTYEFRLKHLGGGLCGTLNRRTSERTFTEKTLTREEKPCELYMAPADYTGFSYTPISDETKATKQELRELLNQKIQESATGSTSALNDLGCMYASGIGVRRNMKMAIANLMEASMKNSLFGMLNMAQIYQEGLGLEKDVEKARELYQRAFEGGYTDAMVLCGDTYLQSDVDADPDYAKALGCYQKAVFRRCPYAFYRLGWLYHEGFGVEKDSEKAWDYYQRACTMQYPDAMTDVGVFYRDGTMVEQDYAKALEYLDKAVTKGNARAMYELSQMYLRGQGVEADFKQSKEWLRKSMETNDRAIEGFNTVKSKIKSILQAGE